MYSSASSCSSVFALVAQPILAEGLANLLANCGALHWCGSCADPGEAADETRRLAPDVVILDHSFGLRTLADVAAALRLLDRPPRLVLWASELPGAERRLAREAGIDVFLDKLLPPDSIRALLESVAVSCPEALSEYSGILAAAPRLTPREIDVVRLVQEGLTNREIGARLSITAGTVKVHLMHVFEKSGIRDRGELTLHASRLLSATGPERASEGMRPAEDHAR